MSAAFHAAEYEEDVRSSNDTPNFSFPRNQRLSRGGPSRASSHLPSHGSDEMSSSMSSETAIASETIRASIYSANFSSPPPAWQPARIWQQSMSDLNAESIPGTPAHPHYSLTPAASSINLHDVRVSSGPSPLVMLLFSIV